MQKIQVVIIDDERAAREEIKRALLPYTDYEVAGEARHVPDALTLIRDTSPGLLFLDVQMPGANGFELLASLSAVPDVIFTTAYDTYAVQAFDNNALDYLLKPFRAERFAQAMEKHRTKVRERAALSGSMVPDKQLFIKDGDQCFFVQQNDIYLVESVNNYARIRTADRLALIKTSLNQLEERLDPTCFFRANRNQLVHARYITDIITIDGGRLQLTIRGDVSVIVSGRQAVRFKQWNKM
ncbi:LytR/AlgR family response regulator transcription factor [Chitinophaga varians]|uniref:LytR/AlgR family response regulator transcription factor n=1 Tax=Chitinophaga varians TaxID=2202339 RepID=UPI00165EF9E5|nr:LytTR family DNA-binding domain-containing protein [Chitinophaga varians]MBC9911877.1 response regulator transcription factor [Chitinophaga varians]